MKSNLDLTSVYDCKSFLAKAKTQVEYGQYCNQIKEANNNDYPRHWYEVIIASGFIKKTFDSLPIR